jgi:hypothetical protein
MFFSPSVEAAIMGRPKKSVGIWDIRMSSTVQEEKRKRKKKCLVYDIGSVFARSFGGTGIFATINLCG